MGNDLASSMVYTCLHVSIALLLVPRFLDVTRLDLTHFVVETLGRLRVALRTTTAAGQPQPQRPAATASVAECQGVTAQGGCGQFHSSHSYILAAANSTTTPRRGPSRFGSHRLSQRSAPSQSQKHAKPGRSSSLPYPQGSRSRAGQGSCIIRKRHQNVSFLLAGLGLLSPGILTDFPTSSSCLDFHPEWARTQCSCIL